MARRIMVLAGLMIAAGAYFVFLRERDDFLFLLGAGLITMTVAFVFQYQIDQLMIRGTPQRLDGPVRAMLRQTAPHFGAMGEDQGRMMEDRIVRWVARRDVITQSEPDPPEEARFILGYYAVLLTLHQQDFLYKGIDRIVFYHHPFLSPRHPDHVHILELESRDGTMIFSLPHLLKGHVEKGYYNTALHVAAAAYADKYLSEPVRWEETIWDDLEAVSGVSRSALETYIGIPVPDPWPVAVHHQVMYRGARIPEVLKVLPQLAQASPGDAAVG